MSNKGFNMFEVDQKLYDALKQAIEAMKDNLSMYAYKNERILYDALIKGEEAIKAADQQKSMTIDDLPKWKPTIILTDEDTERTKRHQENEDCFVEEFTPDDLTVLARYGEGTNGGVPL